ncbi:hypothetical protein MKQ68_15840 [Chitinophaga horti]|uniref:GLPGLI family protein n=1 Tax=Chitinophaga horti TaxID=2920382 RepID=A0ABY6IW11_9BACT|nr:hypothetical protein [Chitinophaga horti]UYQ91563.1 hypothetical protein MKQ68_15840 [Chitinophaga horti]
MKKLMTLCLGILCYSGLSAQRVIKIEPQESADTLTYVTRNAVLTILKEDVDFYLKTLDSVLKERKFQHTAYRNIQFNPLKPEEVRTHYNLVSKFWNTSRGNQLNYNVDRFSLFWSEDDGILLPYLDEMLPDLLEYGRVKVTEKGKLPVANYQVFYEDIEGQTFRVFKLANGKIIWRESEYFLEHFAGKR